MRLLSQARRNQPVEAQAQREAAGCQVSYADTLPQIRVAIAKFSSSVSASTG